MKTKKASTGLTYNQAKAIIIELRQAYKGKISKSVPNEVGGWTTVFTTENMSEEDRNKLAIANKTMTELEQKYNLMGDGYGIDIESDPLSRVNITNGFTPPDDASRLVFTTEKTGYSSRE